ncbi:MAG: hypothetical protein ABW039_10620 [Sphingobium sp.]
MSEPSRRRSRLALAGVFGAAFLCAGVGFAVGRLTAPPAIAPVQRPLPASPVASTPVPAAVTPSVLTRADLLEAAREAMDGMSAGTNSVGSGAYAGRRFELRLPFGCRGASGDAAEPLRWRYDDTSETLRISITPQVWPRETWLPPATQTAVARIEGFWISRPWSSRETCPSDATEPSQANAAIETLGLATFVSSEASRIGRSFDEPFELVKKVEPAAIDAGSGFRLRVTGRLASVPSMGTVACKALDGADRRPTCLISVTLDEIAVENGATGTTLAIWAFSQQGEGVNVTHPGPADR